MRTPIRFLPFWLISKIPWWVGFGISSLLYFFVYYILGYRIEVVRTNLKRSFPDMEEKERQRIERIFYRHLCDLLFESIKLHGLTKEKLLKRISLVPSKWIGKESSASKQIILYSAHIGNWEWNAILPELIHRPVFGLYLPLSNSYFDGLVQYGRRRFGTECIPAQSGYRGIMQQVRKGIYGAFLIIADQSPPRDSKHYYCQFLHQRTAFTIGAETMAEKMKAVVLFPKMRILKRGYYEIEFICLWDGEEVIDPGTITQRYVEALEHAIQEQPQNWLWSHRRWKLQLDTPPTM